MNLGDSNYLRQLLQTKKQMLKLIQSMNVLVPYALKIRYPKFDCHKNSPRLPDTQIWRVRSCIHGLLPKSGSKRSCLGEVPRHQIKNLMPFLLAIENISLIRAAPLFSVSVNSAPEAKTKGNHFPLPMSLQRVFSQFQEVQKEEHPVPKASKDGYWTCH